VIAVKISRWLRCLAAAIVLVSCRKKQPSPQVMMIPSHEESAAAGGSETRESSSDRIDVAGISFSAPAAWRRENPSSQMRAAQFAIPGSGQAKDGLLVVYFFGRNQGGSIPENIERWKGQFTDAAGKASSGEVRTDRKNGLPVTVVTAQGTYASGLPMGPSAPEPNSELWGAIVEGPQGNVFFKATGPNATIGGAKAAFGELLDSLKLATTTM
jgi:hypothetical protein